MALTAGVVLHRLEPLISPVFSALEDGVLRTDEILESLAPNSKGERPPDPHVRAALIRMFAKQTLDDSGRQCEFIREELAFCGLLVIFDSFRIRVLKTSDGCLPGPGRSITRQRFFQQSFDDYLELQGLDESGEVNLIVYWRIVGKNRIAATLACPKNGTDRGRWAEFYWVEPIPHPATAAVLDADDVLDEEELLEDLPIHLLDLELTGTAEGE
jgi:hypothetical protein